MHSPDKRDTDKDKSEGGTPPLRQTGFRGWLNHRTGLDDLLRTALDEPIPGGARFAYIFGSGLLFIFISQQKGA